MAEIQNRVEGSDPPVVLRAPEIPAQGYGTHFEIGVDGRVTFAPPSEVGFRVARTL